MKLKCKNAKCGKVIEVQVKPRTACPHCSKNKGWELVPEAKAEARDTSPCPEWDNSAGVPITPTPKQTFAGLANQHGFPDAHCLGSIYGAIAIPSESDYGKIAFNAFIASYAASSKGLLNKTDLAKEVSHASKGQGAANCAELWFWKGIAGKLDEEKPYMGIGQTVRPCKLCTARFSALAASRAMTIIVAFSEGYDGLPGTSWMAFPPTGGGAAFSGDDG